jgi:hypothetical protein
MRFLLQAVRNIYDTASEQVLDTTGERLHFQFCSFDGTRLKKSLFAALEGDEKDALKLQAITDLFYRHPQRVDLVFSHRGL